MTQTSSQAGFPVPVPFYGDTLFLVEIDGVPYTPLKPIAENLSLTWSAQYEKVSANVERWGVREIRIPSAGGLQKMIGIPVRKLPAFLYSIYPDKVPEEKREKLIKYQEECDDALWNYWTKGVASNPRAELPPAMRKKPASDEVIIKSSRYLELLEAENNALKAEVDRLSYHAKKNRPDTYVDVSLADSIRDLYLHTGDISSIARRLGTSPNTVHATLRYLLQEALDAAASKKD